MPSLYVEVKALIVYQLCKMSRGGILKPDLLNDISIQIVTYMLPIVYINRVLLNNHKDMLPPSQEGLIAVLICDTISGIGQQDFDKL